MADETIDTEQEKLDGVVEQAEELVADATEASEDTVVMMDTVETVVEEDAVEVAVNEVPETLDERVEAAVRHVAEEAKADQSAAAAIEEEPKKKRERRSKQARVAKANAAEETSYEAPKPVKMGGLAALGVPAWIGISAACLVLGLVLGRFALGGGGSASANLAGSTTVTEAQLDDAFATYTYNGTTETITVREVIEQTSTLDDAADEEGNYKIPSAEYAITVARNKILMAEVESRGITVTDDDVNAYAEEALGTSDFDALASTYGMEADTVKQLIEENCRVNALRKEIVGTELPAMPEAPEACEEGEEDKTTKAYAKYIIALAGDEWDKEAGTWADAEGRYATALADYEVTAKSASYKAAEAAYYVAYQIYTEQQTEISEKWNEYFNGLMSNAAIEVGTLVS